MSYNFLRRLLFSLPAETSHHLALGSLRLGHALGVNHRIWGRGGQTRQSHSLLGLALANPVGLAAGLDKNADYIDVMAGLGFGFLEVGTLTPRPQPGNPRPRLFRVPEAEALINRMGFNNKGVDHALARIERSHFKGVLGINIGKNFDTPVERAVDDYLVCMRKAYPCASYLVVNLSSPNTPGLRSLQFGEPLRALLSALRQEKEFLLSEHQKSVPLLLKVAPDLSDEEIRLIAAAVIEAGFDGVIATNTTVSREAIADHALAQEAGGLSGRPLAACSTHVLSQFRKALGPDMPIIGVGGIMSAADVREKVRAGANAVQIYTGFIYRGPALIAEAVRAFEDEAEMQGRRDE